MTRSLVLLLALLAAQGGAFVPMFDGTLTGWSVQGTDADNFAIRDGVLHVEGPNGWLRSQRDYGDFTLRASFRFLTDDADSGIFVRAVGDAPFMRGWPNSSYQVQLRNPLGTSRFPPVGGLFRHGRPDGPFTFDPATATALSRPTGEWQTIELDVIGPRLTVRLNGGDLSSAEGLVTAHGAVGIQGEVGALEFRSIEIREY